MQVAAVLRPPSAVAGADPVTGSPSTAPLSSSQLLPPASIWSARRPLANIVAAASFVIVSGNPEPPRARCHPLRLEVSPVRLPLLSLFRRSLPLTCRRPHGPPLFDVPPRAHVLA